VTADSDLSPSRQTEIVAFGRAASLRVADAYALRLAAVVMFSLATT
jgi:hypothetical protein